MKRPVQIDTSLLETLAVPGESMPEDLRLQHLRAMRDSSSEHYTEVDRYLLARIRRMHRAGHEASRSVQQLTELVNKLTAPPFFPAVFIRFETVGQRRGALVQQGNARRLVDLHPQLDAAGLKRGHEVFLNSEQNVIMGASGAGEPRCGELALFDRKTADGRLVVKWRDDELVMDPADDLAQQALSAGDVVRVDRNAWMVFERFEAAGGREFILDVVPEIPASQLGGQDENFAALLSTLTTILVDPDKARLYGLSGRNSVLMHGPPGCGKTLMTRMAASEISRISGRKCHFGVVKPAAWESPYVGMSQKAIRDTFRALTQAAEDGFSFLFIDEIESVGRTRGGITNVHADRSLAALLAELNGFEDRKNVAIIAATNRKDLVDPALLERLSDLEIPVARPDMRAARQIFRIHLPSTLPFSPNGEAAESTREELIESAVSRFYAPNADNEVCRLRFRDGKERRIHARDLVSGRFFEQVCRGARRRAFLRDVEKGEGGINRGDMEESVEESLRRLRSTLTIHNAHAYLTDLPDDVDVVSVEPVVRRAVNTERFIMMDPV